MRCLVRNKRRFYYAMYKQTEQKTLPNGLLTADRKAVYGQPVEAWGNISEAKGAASVELFGNELSYDRVIVMDNPNCPIDEHTVLFVDRLPKQGAYDYVVKKVARSLNSVSIAIERVNVT